MGISYNSLKENRAPCLGVWAMWGRGSTAAQRGGGQTARAHGRDCARTSNAGATRVQGEGVDPLGLTHFHPDMHQCHQSLGRGRGGVRFWGCTGAIKPFSSGDTFTCSSVLICVFSSYFWFFAVFVAYLYIFEIRFLHHQSLCYFPTTQLCCSRALKDDARYKNLRKITLN